MRKTQGPMRPSTDIPQLPGKSFDEFFYPDSKTLTIPWIYYFEKLARGPGGDGAAATHWSYTITAGIGIGGDCSVGTNICPPFEIKVPGAALEAVANCKTAPAGADLIIDVMANGVSIFGDTKLVIAAGANRGAQNVFAGNPFTFMEGDRITVNCLQVGSTTPGRDVTFEIEVVA